MAHSLTGGTASALVPLVPPYIHHTLFTPCPSSIPVGDRQSGSFERVAPFATSSCRYCTSTGCVWPASFAAASGAGALASISCNACRPTLRYGAPPLRRPSALVATAQSSPPWCIAASVAVTAAAVEPALGVAASNGHVARRAAAERAAAPLRLYRGHAVARAAEARSMEGWGVGEARPPFNEDAPRDGGSASRLVAWPSRLALLLWKEHAGGRRGGGLHLALPPL